MKKGVKGLVISIIFTISIILISIPVWYLANGNKIGILANYYGEYDISVKIGSFEPLIVISEEQAPSIISPTKISLTNRNGFSKNTDLFLLIDKNSTISYDFIRVSLNNEIKRLNELEIFEDEFNYYFKLDNYNINSYETVDLEAKIWLDTSVTGLTEESSIITNFIVERG